MRSKALLLLSTALFFASCSSTSVVSSWKSPQASVGSIDNILVLGVMGAKERPLKIELENTIVAELQKKGIKATGGTQEFGPNGLKGLSEEQVANKISKDGFSSVMIVSLLDKEKEKNYVPGTVYTTPNVVGYSRYYRRYLVVYDRVYTPGYYSTSTNYMLQAEIYSTPQNELLYSAQTESYNPNSSARLAKSFTKSIIKNIESMGLVR